jgi:hypothetical protein
MSTNPTGGTKTTKIETIAELELFGLSMENRELLNRLEIIYIRDLQGIDATWIRARSKKFGKVMLANLREALWNFIHGKAVKTVTECIGRVIPEAQTPEPRLANAPVKKGRES